MSQQKTPIGHTIFGRQAAIHVTEDSNRHGRHTLALEGAFKTGADYDWQQKLSLQLTLRELPIFACTCLGWRTGCVFDQRGGSGKGFSLEWQKDRIFIRLWQGTGHQYQVQAEPADIFHLSALALRQCQALYGLDGAGVHMALKACVLPAHE